MKTKLLYGVLLTILTFNINLAQNSDVLVTVKWPDSSFQNKIEIYNTANDLLFTLCDDNQCYTGSLSGATDAYGGKYDMGCVTNGNNYYVKLYHTGNSGWNSGYVSVVVAGTEVINDNGLGATTAGQTIFFNVSGGDANCNTLLDTDSDGVIDTLDYDDDADGLTDAAENLGEDRFQCTLPALDFENGAYDAAASTAAAGLVGAVYRFGNAIEGKDVLLEIMELDNATIANIDNDTIDNPTYLQTELTLTDPGTPGARFKFTIVDAGTTTPSTEIFRINGITWDCDGGSSLYESVIYYDVAAYGTENPTSLTVTDLGSNNIQISASGLQEGPGFSNLKVLRAYYQFIGNSFEMRMQGIRSTTGSTTRQFGMSFTQCEFLDFNANSLIIITGEDFDGDGKYNHLDLDSDNDGIPDNIEAQPTLGYIAPSGTIDRKIGVDQLYGSGLTPIDTDLDNTPDVLDLDSDSDGLLDIEENGMANAIVTFSDSDDDGLDLLFEGTNINDPLDVNDEINSPEASILPDADGDVFTGGDVDYRDLFNTNPPASATLDFDGVDDYLSTPNFIDGTGEVTLMAWMKYDAGASGDMIIAGEGNGIKLWIKGGNKPYFSVTVAGYPIRNVAFGTLPSDEWHHMVGTYSATTGLMKIYIDGKLKSTSDFGVTGLMIQTAPAHNGNFEIGRSSRNQADREYFKGAIDEVRVFDTVLTEDQIQRSVYQEIEQNSGNVRGSVIDKDILDQATDTKILWNSLIAYYPMTDIVNSKTFDRSNNSKDLYLFNITSVQAQTAPMPYESSNDGAWTTEATWLHGDVWDIEDVANNKDWSIVRINDNVTTSNSHTQLGMIIENNKSLTVSGDNEINNSWYLEINGSLDLGDDSQLVQGNKSDLVTSANGKVLRRQSGASNVFWYTYMSSPVGATAATTLSDNNTAANNANNTAFTFNTLKEGNGSLVQFTNAHNEVGKISTRWMYTFQNGITYFDWAYLYPTTALNPGVGYIHKGTGNAGLEQQYLFEGKPNNGTVLIAADDVDGDAGNESQPDVTQTTTLIGNPYPSAIDAHKFIDDNISVIDGTIYLWQQWAGDNHILREYEGGYAVLNKMAKIRAYQFVGYSGADNGSQDGTLTPTRYIAPGQSFMTEVVADGNIEFNNAQRIFKKESNGETEFFRNTASTKGEEEKEEMTKIILNFVTSDNRSRELVIGFGDQTTEGYDRGYDAKMFDLKSDDIYMKLNSDKLIANAQPTLNANMEIPIGLKATGSYKYKIKATKLINFPSTMDIYLRDNQEKIYHDLRDGAYTFKSKSGEFNNRFDIVFAAKGNTKETQQEALNDVQIYFNTNSDRLFVKGLNNTAKELTITNMAGQQLIRLNNISTQRMTAGVALSNLSNGVYIVSILTDTNQSIDKKIIID